MFKDTWAYNHWDWSKTNPVLHFSFDRMAYQALGLDGAILQELNLKAKEHGIELVNDDIKSAFNELLEKVSQKHGKVALLIDEYDKPIIDYLAPRLCNNNRLYTGGIRISF